IGGKIHHLSGGLPLSRRQPPRNLYFYLIITSCSPECLSFEGRLPDITKRMLLGTWVLVIRTSLLFLVVTR
ncbi:uncharacterized protein A4U43_C04F18900, partial [Asparagus officinalis]